MTDTSTGRRLIERHSFLRSFRKWRPGLEKFDETRRRSRGRRRWRGGVDGEIGGSKSWEIGSKTSTIRRQRTKMRRARKREDIQWSPTTRRRPEGRRKIERDERRARVMETEREKNLIYILTQCD